MDWINDDTIEIIKKKLLSSWKLDQVELDTALRVVQLLTLWEFNSLWKAKTKTSIWGINPSDIFQDYSRNKLFSPANGNFLKLKRVEDLMIETFQNDYDLMEVSPIVPIWLNRILWWIDSNKSIVTLNNAELLSEITILLALECSRRAKESWVSDININIASVARLIRNQTSEKDYYLPHFKIFWWTTVIKWVNTRDKIDERISIILCGVLKFLKLLQREWLDIQEIEIEFWNSHLLHKIIHEKWGYSNPIESVYEYKKTWRNNIMSDLQLWIPNILNTAAEFWDFWLDKYWKIFNEVEKSIIDKMDDPVRFYYNIWRLWWIGHYDGLMFTIFIKDSQWNRYDIMDWWMTDWWERLLADKKVKTVVFAVWTELLANNF